MGYEKEELVSRKPYRECIRKKKKKKRLEPEAGQIWIRNEADLKICVFVTDLWNIIAGDVLFSLSVSRLET